MSQHPSHPPIRVLLVDDEPDMRRLLGVMLERTGDIEVAGEAATGDEALDRVKELAPDLVLLDQMMPGLSGIETARRMLADDRSVRIVLFSAHIDARLRGAAEEVGILECLSKDEFAAVADVIRATAA